MLNYIWLSLIGVGVGLALWNDARDLSTDRYHNGQQIDVTLRFTSSPRSQAHSGGGQECTVQVSPVDFKAVYNQLIDDTIRQRAEYIETPGTVTGALRIFVDAATPALWKDIYAAQGSGDFLLAHGVWGSQTQHELKGARRFRIGFDPVRFVRLNSVTNDGIIKYAKTAVELAIGLIGIMALWLGIMKIAEQSGLVSKLAALLKPLTTRLFPDVPADHPAMGAMIMNISANMLGLANAATPLGLKAMEELDKLNKKAGTATDAMCTFLVINTSNVQLIPATVIAIRAASGSANPTDILGPVIVATAVALIAGVVTVRLLARLPVYRRQLEEVEA